MVMCICVRGSTLAQVDTALVLPFEGRAPCSTSYYSPRRKNTSTLRVITLQAERYLLYELLLFELYPAIDNISTSHYSPRRKNTPTLRVITVHWEYPYSTSYYSQAGKRLLHELLFSKQADLCSSSYDSQRGNVLPSRRVTRRVGLFFLLEE